MLLCFTACSSTLTPAETAEILGHGETLTRCQLEARAAQSQCLAGDAGHCDPLARAAYAACKDDAGVK